MKKTLFLAMSIMWGACEPKQPNLLTKSVKAGDTRLVVQKLPDSYGNSAGDTAHVVDYFRLIVTCNQKFDDTASVNYINFGMEQSVSLIRGKDTIAPDFFQRIANGKSKVFEYIAAFNQPLQFSQKGYSIYLQDQVFGLGKVIVHF